MADYLYLEAVNLAKVISDTEDLSTRRAGGYMLLELVHEVATACDTELKPLSLGASAGLFELKSGKKMPDARDKVNEVLSRPLLSQATVIVVDTKTLGIRDQDFSLIRERLRAAVRLRQVQTLAMVTDFGELAAGSALKSADIAVCKLDGLRPARSLEVDPEGKDRPQSRSVTLRRADGRSLRQRFYQRELGRRPGAEAYTADNDHFTDDLGELSRFSQAELGHLSPLIEHKIAVFYADGNGFGSVGAKCKTGQDLEAWDTHLQSRRRGFLASLLDFILRHPHGLTRRESGANPYRLRIETLMWGGDEFLLVVPAWLGLQVAQHFFETCRVDRPDLKPAGQLATHAASLVFAHHKAPISQLQRLAKTLAEQGKKDTSPYKGHDSLHWMVLESFDHAGANLHDDGQAYWAQRRLPLTWPQMALNPARLCELVAAFGPLADTLPRRNLYRILDGLPRWGELTRDDDDLRLLRQAYINLHEAAVDAHLLEDWKSCWKALQPNVLQDLAWPDTLSDDFAKPEHLNAWLTLTELWDYLAAIRPPLSSDASTTAIPAPEAP